MTIKFSDYIVYVDESGDHGLKNIDKQYPVFVLVFCVFKKSEYMQDIVSEVQKLKFNFWGHDGIILHSHEIRKARGDFNILLNKNVREEFIASMNKVIDSSNFTLIASIIDKKKLIKKYNSPDDPYKLALSFCIERLQYFLGEKNQQQNLTHLMVECRGKPEDSALELEFRRICDGKNKIGNISNLDIIFMDKKHNSAGLQFADLVAHPIGRNYIKPQQPNKAFEVIKTKFTKSKDKKIEGYGLKIFPR